ncbi:carbonate dehydratase [Pseudoxanthomonas broegbernensis]|uniref:Carbonic anhydrase n=1 Tax=Pseudoxanthomonas broegbernensis TaxID=83619 RepID=A0A7V8GPT1_9GAMM|nr:carbonate dehydratase [Pseudoxanthomonas broegbernensis]KAF1687779.1 carbonate dehydratase [Pseudoxanthomonas broegbernensis]MBB6064818.1 carbonic anhydrase [Pseudoxanthomonas broegbernensis]
MPHTLNELIRRNQAWSERLRAEDPDFFSQLSQQQAPEYLWIGCSDSRVPANQIIDMAPGEVFVHRNVANVVVHTDLNCLSVVQYAVDVLQVKHILVVGHYGCGGVQAALTNQRLGLVDNWIRHVGDVAERHAGCLHAAGDIHAQHSRLCELNVLEQVINLSRTTIIRDAWARGQKLAVHGWVYGLSDGRVHDLGIDVDSLDTLPERYRAALARICQDDGGER